MNTKFKINILLFSLIILITSCVGTVKDENPQLAANQSSGDSSKAISFDGLVNAVAISQDKIELYFRPAEGDKSALTYEIYVNNGPVPIKITGNSLALNAAGLYVFTVASLQMNTTYTFNMRAVLNGANDVLKLDPAKSMSSTTFKNETADFAGISSVALGAGESGRDTVTVKWVPATILGTNINPRNTDPVAYEISYVTRTVGARNINNVNYTGAGRNVITIPYPISNPPALNKDSQYTINGLTPGETYFFQVRAIHKGYILYKSDLSYKREENTRFLSVTTLNNAGLFDFNEALVNITSPQGESGLTNLNISWIPAGGEFKQYRLCYKKVANPGDPTPIADYLQDADIDALLSNTTACLPLDANLTAYTLNSLTTYAFYQAKVIACRTFDCDLNNRIKSSLLQKRVMANLAPFNGVLTILNPTDETKLKNIRINFDSPVVSAGYMNKFSLYCYSSSSDTSPVAIPDDGTISASTGKPGCDGIQLVTPMPSSLADYGVLTSLEVQLPVIDGNARYCFSLLPSIRSQYIVQEDLTTAVIKCVTPEIKTPTIVQFPGRNDTCAIAGKNLSINWPTPTGGLYTKFVILYREKQNGSNFFNFEDATLAYRSNNNLTYKWVDNLDRNTVDYTFNNLVQGRTYNIGVLPYLEDGAVKRFAQYNVNIGQCTLPLPTPSFTEWVDIFAIGPKEDGLTPVTNAGVRRYILESLDNDGIPVDLLTTAADPKAPDTVNDPLASSRLGTTVFNGTYGALDGKDTNPLHQYSNSGIIKLGWKDVTFYGGTENMSSFIANPTYESTPGVKTQRKFGYKVYRSDDNQMTWLDLTKNSTANKFQTVANSGLVHPVDYTWRARNNAAANIDKIVFFTDYSVKFSGTNEEVDRARVYFYKIIPVFDGKELDYGQAGNTTHHIIKVTLPPRNMALVHRMMANRTICLEMDKTINTNTGGHYSCDFNGLGASGLSQPWALGSTVYDQGGDLLIDRFELSCPFTRGDQNYTNSDSEFNIDKLVFKGRSTFNNPFKGCYNNEGSSRLESALGSPTMTSNYVFKQTIPGDCFGRELGNQAAAVACPNPLYPETRQYHYPGSPNLDFTNECSNSARTGEKLFDLTDPTSEINTSNQVFPTQSEFAAVYYSRTGYSKNSEYDLNPGALPGGSNQKLLQNARYNNGSCSVNLNWVNTNGEYRPRWMPISALFERLYTTAKPGGLNLYNKKMSEVLSDTSLYDASAVKAPVDDLIVSNRYKSTSTLARVVTSNSAKLPPLEGLAPSDFNGICSTYKVQVGLETSTKPFTLLDNKTYSKRLMRKKESTVAAAWPATYNSTTVTNIESGNFTENGIEKGCNSVTKSLPSGTNTITKAAYLSPVFPHSNETHPSLMVGNSSRDYSGNNATSEKCVSKFGVQDLVGNLQEYNSDQIFCDYNEDKLYLGKSKNIAQSVEVSSTSPLYDPNSLVPWVLSTPASGSCSIVEAGGTRTGTYLANSYLAPIFDWLGNLNASVVFRAKNYDQNSINSARNGDGSFLDFGQDNIAPKLSIKNSIATMDDDLGDGITPPFYAKYFNAALGIPLLCEKGCAGDAADNTMIASDQICTNKNCNTFTPVPAIQNFPTNNSRFSNVGTGDFNATGRYSSLNPNQLGFTYASDLVEDSNPANNYLTYSSANVLSSTPGLAYDAYFSISRGSSLKMITGGSYKANSGRYSLHIYGNNTIYERSMAQVTGSRCSVLINEDE